MKITNKYNLRRPLYHALLGVNHGNQTRPYRFNPREIGVTTLIRPVQITLLQIRHDPELEEDASSRIWTLLGSALHEVLGRSQAYNSIIEVPVETHVLHLHFDGGIRTYGRFDLWSMEKPRIRVLQDYKITSVWAYVFGDGKDFADQINVYDFCLWEGMGIDSDELEITLLFRDWSRNKAQYDRDYPQIPFGTIKVDKWPRDKQREYIRIRAYDLNYYFDADDDELPECSPTERWASPDQWAVKRKGAKKAYRVYDQEWIAEKQAYELNKPKSDDKPGKKKAVYVVEYRPGAWTRCEEYCPVSGFCHQFKAHQKGK